MSSPEAPRKSVAEDPGKKGEVTPRHEAAFKQMISLLEEGFPVAVPDTKDDPDELAKQAMRERVLGLHADKRSQREMKHRSVWAILRAYARIEADLGVAEATGTQAEDQMEAIEVNDFVIIRPEEELIVYVVDEVTRNADTGKLEGVVLRESGTEGSESTKLSYSAREYFDQIRQIEAVVKRNLLDKHRKK